MKLEGERRFSNLISRQVVLVGGLSVASASRNLKRDSKKFVALITFLTIAFGVP